MYASMKGKFDIQNTLVNTVFKTHGSKVLQDKYLPQLATEKLGSFCLSEPASGSDAFVRASLLTRFNNLGTQNPCGQNKRWVCTERVKDVGGTSQVILNKGANEDKRRRCFNIPNFR